MTVVTPDPNVQAQIDELREQRQRIAPEALKDHAAATKLCEVESELAEAQHKAELLDLAGRERERREEEARERAAAQSRAKAVQRARELQSEREAGAHRIDRAAKALGEALHAFDQTCEAQRVALVEADQAPDSVHLLPFPITIESALAYWLRQAHAPAGLIRFDGATAGREAPLAESDHRPIEPVEGDGPLTKTKGNR